MTGSRTVEVRASTGSVRLGAGERFGWLEVLGVRGGRYATTGLTVPQLRELSLRLGQLADAIEDQARSLAALGGTPGADRPSPYALWRQANGDRDAYIALMKQHGHLVPREPSADSVTDQVTVIAEAKYAVEMLDLLCEMGFGTDMATSVPVSVPLRDALARRYQEREKDGVGAGMTHSDWRHVIDAGLPPLGIEAPASSEEGR